MSRDAIAPHYGGESVGYAAYHVNEKGISFDPKFSRY